jgi:hypothetical protein
VYNIGTHDRLQGAAPGATWVSSSPSRKGCDGGCRARRLLLLLLLLFLELELEFPLLLLLLLLL